MLDKEIIEEIVRRIVPVASPTRIILFGSHARGDADEDSDVDLLVVVEETDSRRELAIKVMEALGDLTIPTDIIVTTDDIIDRYSKVPGVIYEVATSEGKVVYAA